ncbi:hypothetical protein H4S07_007083, partial [Coemansia furcata]
MSDEYDPTADFLAQERAALGDAADFFQVTDTTPQQATPSFTNSDAFVPTPSIAESNNSEVFGLTNDRIQSPVSVTRTSPNLLASSEFEQEWQGKQREI